MKLLQGFTSIPCVEMFTDDTFARGCLNIAEENLVNKRIDAMEVFLFLFGPWCIVGIEYKF